MFIKTATQTSIKIRDKGVKQNIKRTSLCQMQVYVECGNKRWTHIQETVQETKHSPRQETDSIHDHRNHNEPRQD